jgi:hypothetical protein
VDEDGDQQPGDGVQTTATSNLWTASRSWLAATWGRRGDYSIQTTMASARERREHPDWCLRDCFPGITLIGISLLS